VSGAIGSAVCGHTGRVAARERRAGAHHRHRGGAVVHHRLSGGTRRGRSGDVCDRLAYSFTLRVHQRARILIARELKASHVVFGTHAAGNGQALVRLHIPDLIHAAARHIGDPPPPGRIGVAVELEGSDVVVGADATGNGQAFARLHIPQLIDVSTGPLAQGPTT